MSNQALYNQYPIKSPRKLASGNRWLNKTRAAIQQEPAPATCKGVPNQDTPDHAESRSPLNQRPQENPHPVLALHRIAAQAAAMTTLLEDAQKQRRLTTEESLALRAGQSLTRNLSAVARNIEPLLPDADEE